MKLTELQDIYNLPFFDLISRSRQVYLEHWNGKEVQLCTLLSIKTGGCSEDCSYCSQSAHNKTDLERQKLMTAEEVMPYAESAKANGSTRFCMGAAWKGIRESDPKFETVLDTIRRVSKLGMEVCVTLGELTETEAIKLKEAGVTAYNHNIDTSPEFYPEIVSTHSFQDRLNTIQAVQSANMAVCCGGILGMGESITDRLRMLEVLTNFDPAPESVPINSLMPICGTPMEGKGKVDTFDLIRMIATARIALPKAKIRLSAGRENMSKEAQAMAFFAGANSVFYGEKLLTTSNPGVNDDLALLEKLNLSPLEPDLDETDEPHGCHRESERDGRLEPALSE